MRVVISVFAMVFGAATGALASPITSSSARLLRRDGPGPMTPDIGPCPTDCWNQAAVTANCDPNTDDDCLCGPFFQDVTQCTAAACGIADNLATLDFLNPACE